MKVMPPAMPEALFVQTQAYGSERSVLFESVSQEHRKRPIGKSVQFVLNPGNVLRGAHGQARQAQGESRRALQAESFHVAVYIRRDSSSFSQFVGNPLSTARQRRIIRSATTLTFLWPAEFRPVFPRLDTQIKSIFRGEGCA